VSELSLNLAAAPELPAGAAGSGPSPAGSAGAANWKRSDPSGPADGEGAGKAFAALLTGILQGTQPPAQAAVLAVPGSVIDPALDLPPDDGTGPLAPLVPLALPGSATPLPAVAAGTTATGSLSGQTLPLAGRPLPAELAKEAEPEGATPAARGARDPPAAPSAGEVGPRISLADLALSRPLEPTGNAVVAVDETTADSTALVRTGRSLTARNARTDDPGSGGQDIRRENLSATLLRSRLQTPIAATASPDGPALRPTTLDRLPAATSGDGSSPQLLQGTPPGQQLPVFAVVSGRDVSQAAAIPRTDSGAADSGSSAVLARLGSTTLPALQPLGDASHFAGGLADRLLTLGGPGAHSAHLKLYPEHLGQLDVRIQMDDGTAQVWFGTTSSQAREAIEGSLPRLRELFADQGIQLTRTQVDTGTGQTGNPGSGHHHQWLAGSPPGEPDLRWRGQLRPAPLIVPGLPRAALAPARLLDVWA
jgi:flagellar hook-length control protein FliK